MEEMTKTQGGMFTGAEELVTSVYNKGVVAQKALTEAQKTFPIVDVDGINYVWKNGYLERIEPVIPEDVPVPDAMSFFTLDGLIDYIVNDTESIIPILPEKPLMVHVVNEQIVVLWSLPNEHHKERHVIARCAANVPKIEFGMYMDTDAFNTMLLSKFIDSDARALLFKVVSNLTNEQKLAVADDGVSQVVTVKTGVQAVSNTQFKNPCPLRPMRTFPEVEQVESNFTLRVNEKANCALFEADGGAWRNESVARIREYLREKLNAVNVVVIG